MGIVQAMRPDLLTPAEAAARLGVTTKTVRRWAEAGLIEAVRLPSGQLRYPADAVTAAAQPTEQVAS
jgi:excisionase family DNA binding protein